MGAQPLPVRPSPCLTTYMHVTQHSLSMLAALLPVKVLLIANSASLPADAQVLLPRTVAEKLLKSQTGAHHVAPTTG